MKRWAVLALCACPSASHDALDTVAGELTTPVHATLRVREIDQPADCSDATGIIDRFGCAFRSTPVTCAWLEVESAELSRQTMGLDFDACRTLPGVGPRVGLHETSPAVLRVVADESGQRLAVRRDAASATVLWLIDDVVVGSQGATWPVKWADVQTLDQALPTLYAAASGDAGERLLAYARQTGKHDALLQLMADLPSDAFASWWTLYDALQDEAEQHKALAALHERLRAERPLALVTALIDEADLQPKDFADVVAAAASDALGTPTTAWYDVGPLLTELLARHDPRAGELACRVYGGQVLASLSSLEPAYYDLQDPEAEHGALSILAHSRAACPWVQVAIDRDPCNSTYRCLADGGVPNPFENDDDSESPDYYTRPLCSPAVAKAAANAKPATSEDDDQPPDPPAGVVLLGAAYDRGLVSRELLTRNARRLYRFDYPPVEPFDAGEGEDPEMYSEGPCRDLRTLPDAVCALPLALKEVTYGGCRLRIDDVKKIVRIDAVK